MTPAWMNPQADYYVNHDGTHPSLEVLSGLGQSGDGDASSSPYAAVFPYQWSNQPTTFATAATVQVFVPVRRGMEQLASQLLGGDAQYQQAWTSFLNDLATLQATMVPDPPAPPAVYQLASWQEFMPTDGTYVDTILGNCNAADSLLTATLESQSNLRNGQAAVLHGRQGGQGDAAQVASS